MYHHLNGQIAHLQTNLAVIDCGGVGYKCYISENTYKTICKLDKTKLYTFLNVKEDTLDLYGFATEQEKQFFELLISINGVGPKAAVSILSTHTPETFASCVITSNINGITKAAGIGQKLAQRICLELKDKIAKTKVEPKELGDEKSPAQAGALDAVSDAIDVLVALGYSKNDASKAVLRCPADNTNDIVKQALRLLSKNI